MNKIKAYILNWAKKRIEADNEDTMIKLSLELVEVRKKLREEQEKNKITPLSKGELTMKQLGSFVPSFEVIAQKTNDEKLAIGAMCSQIIASSFWKYLIDHLKQDQVNLFLFDDNRKSEDFVRGTINGIYVVDEQINLLGTAYDDKQRKGMTS